MDQLSLNSILTKIRNTYGARRWGYMRYSAPPSASDLASAVRIPQQNRSALATRNTPFRPTQIRPNRSLTIPLSFRDQWERPSFRRLKLELTTQPLSAVQISQRVLLATSGTPFLAVDPFQAAVEYRPKVGDEVLLDDNAGNEWRAKIVAFDPGAFPSGNAIEVAGDLPADGTYFVTYLLDAFHVRLTVSYMTEDLSPMNVVAPAFQSKIRTVYYDNAGATVDELYLRSPIAELSTLLVDTMFTTVPVVGDRFGATTGQGTTFEQVFEVFDFYLARVPDVMELVLDNPAHAISMVVGNIGLTYGHTVPAHNPVPPTIIPPDPDPAPETLYNLMPAPDPEDFWTGAGDIVLMPAGMVCPPGYESMFSPLSQINQHVITNTANPLIPTTFNLTMTSAPAGAGTLFSGVLAGGSAHPFANETSASASFVALFDLQQRHPGEFGPVGQDRGDKWYSIRIPEITFDSAGNFSFILPGTLAEWEDRVGLAANTTVRCRIFISGILEAGNLHDAGQYQRPRQFGINALPVETEIAAGPPPIFEAEDDRLLIPLDEVFVGVGDVITFLDENGNPLVGPPTPPGSPTPPDQTGPSFLVTAIDEEELVVQDLLDFQGAPDRVTEVWRYLATQKADPENNLSVNAYRVESVRVTHTHLLDGPEPELELKTRNRGGRRVTHVDHVHNITPQAVLPPYAQFHLCVKL